MHAHSHLRVLRTGYGISEVKKNIVIWEQFDEEVVFELYLEVRVGLDWQIEGNSKKKESH